MRVGNFEGKTPVFGTVNQTAVCYICDAIKQNESELEKNENTVFVFIIIPNFRPIVR